MKADVARSQRRLDSPAVSSVVHSVQDQSCAAKNGGCAAPCSGEAAMPFGEPPPALGAPAAWPSSAAPAGPYGDRPATSPVAPPNSGLRMPGTRRVIVPPASDSPAMIPGSRGADVAPAETYQDSSAAADDGELGLEADAAHGFLGEHNLHSPLEWTCLEEMATAVKVVVELARIWGERGAGFQPA